ncbi:MlaA family lipoprotein [Thauera sp. 63]|jgi:phospholipid-binding lipoprotein MlaA|uniref:MlaA family lipoprotein n=1 Tax=Thauera sp. 63 TaxID=497321 RepID=UPI0002CE3365|nr:VacJ family lipoprotein [Thauera sp. 63]ENO79528.1 VacJ family lipoprotein [Thauera sp. 63]
MNAVAKLSRKPLAVAALSVSVLSGCATTANPDDPLEGYNRAMFSFNEQLDKVVVKPAAQAYEFVLPQFVRTGVGNFIGNLEDPWIGLNNLMQGKGADGMSDLMRFFVNSTFGLLGVLDVATEMGLPKHDEDLGQTLGRWGVGEGAYIVLPLFGSRTVRDAVALPADRAGQSPLNIDHVPTRNSYTALRITHVRSTFLGAEKTVDEATIDKYAYTRDFYLEQRRYKVSDGNVTREYENFDARRAPELGEELDMAATAAVERLELNRMGGDKLADSSIRTGN